MGSFFHSESHQSTERVLMSRSFITSTLSASYFIADVIPSTQTPCISISHVPPSSKSLTDNRMVYEVVHRSLLTTLQPMYPM